MFALLKRSDLLFRRAQQKECCFLTSDFHMRTINRIKQRLYEYACGKKTGSNMYVYVYTNICARAMCTDEVTRLTLRSNDRDAPILVRGRPGGRTPQVDTEASLFIGRKI